MHCRFLKIFIVLLTSFLLVSCTTKMTYRFLDWVVAWSVDDYVNWDRQQQREFDQRLDQQLDWHQSTQLPRYSALLSKFRQDLEQPLNEDLMLKKLDQVAVLWSDMLQHLAPDITFMMSSLSDSQVEELIENLQKNIVKTEEKYTNYNTEDLDKERVKRVEKFAKRFIGRLSEEQQQLIENWSAQLIDSRQQWLQSRRLWAERFEAALQQRKDHDFDNRIDELFVRPKEAWDSDYQQTMDAKTRMGVELVIALQASLSDKQREYLYGELNEWITVFDQLAAEVNVTTSDVP